jgi:TonB family protein
MPPQQDHLAEDHLAPTPVEVTDVSFPTAGPGVAIVSLIATVEPDGHVSEIQVADSNGSTLDGARYEGTLVGYVENSIIAVKQWRFSPAIDSTLRPARSHASIIFSYDRIFDTGVLPTMSVIPPKVGSYLPALPFGVWRAQLPLNLFVPGTVVLKVHVDPTGSVSDSDIIKSVPSENEPTIRASKKWQFQPARYADGKPVRSTATVVFVFLNSSHK